MEEEEQEVDYVSRDLQRQGASEGLQAQGQSRCEAVCMQPVLMRQKPRSLCVNEAKIEM